MAQCLVHRLGGALKDAIITPDSSSVTVYGGNGSNNVPFTYTGDGTVSASSSNTGVATVAISGNNVVVTYVAPGSATITVSAPKTKKYKECSATFSVTCSRTALTKPSLTQTSFSTTGNTCTPGYNNYNSSLMTVSGTTSASSPGSYAIYFNLKDTNRYCWSDGTTGQVGCSWSVSAGNITFYVRDESSTYTFTIKYNTTVRQNSPLYSTNSTYAGQMYLQGEGTTIGVRFTSLSTSTYINSGVLSPTAIPSNGATYKTARTK